MALDSEAQTSWKDHTIYVKKNYPVARSDATRCDAMRSNAKCGIGRFIEGSRLASLKLQSAACGVLFEGLAVPCCITGHPQPTARGQERDLSPQTTPQCALPKGPVGAQRKSMQILSALPASVQRRQSWSRQVVLHLSFLCREPQIRIKVKRSWAKHRKTLRDNA